MKAKGNLRPVVDPELISALSHPLRVHILDALSEAASSPSDLAREAGLSVNYVAYHVKELEKLGYLELVKTEPRRGTVEHYYRVSRRLLFDDSEWERLPAPVKQGFSAGLCRTIVREMHEALEAGTFDARAGHLSRTRLLVDEQGWDDLNAALSEALERVLAIQAECAERIDESEGDAIPAAVSIAGFEAPPRSAEPDSKASSTG